MAVSVRGARPQAVNEGLRDAPRLDYDYGDGRDLKPGSKLSDFIRDRIIERADDSASFLRPRFESWNRIDEVLTTYVKADDAESILKSEDPRKPISIVFPNTYAILETMLSYMATAFFTDPLFRYEGVGSEDIVGATLLQAVVQQQAQRAKMVLNLHTQFRDAFAYGVGAVHPYWQVKRGTKPSVVVDEFGNSVIELQRDQVLCEGGALRNIDPYLMLLDPNTPVNEIQNGEYFGWITRTNRHALLSAEREDSDMFNARYLRYLSDGRTAVVDWEPSSRGKKTKLERSKSTDQYTSPVDVVTMFVKIVPSEWKLGDSDYPELWLFELAGDEVVLKATPAEYMHGMLPVSVCAPEFDGYGIAPISRLEIQSGLQGVLDWLFSSHITNVRKALNDMLVVDPFLVNYKDVVNPGPGRIIRLRKPAWGQGVKNAVQQLAVTDVTRGHMNDAGFIVQMMQQLSGSDSPVMGVLRQGGPERLTSAEFQGTQAGSISRLERIARLVSYQSMTDLGKMLATNTQQFMQQPTWIKSMGSLPEQLQREFAVNDRVAVDPTALIVDYDVVVRDGSIPGGNYSDAWIQLFQIIGSQPELQQRFDVGRLFKHIARNLGAKDVEQFERQQMPGVVPGVLPDDTVQSEAEAGNLVNVGAL